MYLAVGLLVFAHFIACSDAGDAASCPAVDPEPTTRRLRRQLFCDYDAKVRPVKHDNNGTIVEVLMNLKSLIFLEDWNTLQVHSWNAWRWNDNHLTWDIDEFDQLKEIRVSSSEVWVPDLGLWTGSDMGTVKYGIAAATTCHLNNKGRVMCVAPTVHSALCTSDLTRWPLDSQECSMMFGSWGETGKGVILNITDTGMDNTTYTPNRDWELLRSTVRLRNFTPPNATFPISWILYSFNLRRHSGGHAATVFVPSLVLVVFTMAIFCTNAHSAERIYLVCLNVLCHCLYLQYLSVKLPSNGDKYPIILTFYRDSLLMVCATLCVTLLARAMDAARNPPPAWIVAVTVAVTATWPGRVLVSGSVDDLKLRSGEDEVTETIEALRRDKRWHRFAVLLDRVVFLVFLLTFVVLLCAFVP